MSWDRPSGGDRPEENQSDRLDKNGERPFPGAPLDRPAVPPPDWSKLPSVDEWRERHKAFPGDPEGYERAGKSGFWESDEWQNRNGGEQGGRPLLGSRAESSWKALHPESEPDADHLRGPGKGTEQAEEHVSRMEGLDSRQEGAAEDAEQAESAPEAGDQLSETDAPKEPDQAPDRNAEHVERLERQIERKDQRIERLEERNDRLQDRNDRLADENAKLRKELAETREVREADDSGEPSEVAAKQNNDSEAVANEPTKKRKIGLPGTEAVSVFSGIVGSSEAVGAVTHSLSSGEQGLIGAGATLGVAVYLYGKKKWEDRHGDKPEG